MQTKTHHVQIRVTANEKAALKRFASRSGLDVSSYVLGRALPSQRLRFEEIVRALGDATEGRDVAAMRFALAELNDFLTALLSGEFADAVTDADVQSLDPFIANYLAALVEQAAARHSVAPPSWTRAIAPLDEPYFAGGLKSLRPHLLREAPVPFKRRNLFVDSSLGDRV
jgi:hypothetical protein